MVMKGCCFVWPYRSADRVKKPKSNFGFFFSSARNLFSSRGLPHDYGWVFSSTTVIMKFKIKDRKCIEICMTPEFSADMGSKWILALWVCVDLVSLCWEAQGGRTLCLVMGPALSLHALPGMNSFWDCCWDREQNFGKSTVGKVFPKLTRTPASILGRNPKGLEHWRKPERERQLLSVSHPLEPRGAQGVLCWVVGLSPEALEPWPQCSSASSFTAGRALKLAWGLLSLSPSGNPRGLK